MLIVGNYENVKYSNNLKEGRKGGINEWRATGNKTGLNRTKSEMINLTSNIWKYMNDSIKC